MRRVYEGQALELSLITSTYVPVTSNALAALGMRSPGSLSYATARRHASELQGVNTALRLYVMYVCTYVRTGR